MDDVISLPTGKSHISYSELTDWSLCPFRHNVIHVRKLVPKRIGPALAMGTAIHSGCEHYLRTREVDLQKPLAMISVDYEEHKNDPEYFWFKEDAFRKSLQTTAEILLDFPDFMDEQFPDWKFRDAELQLYEPIAGKPGLFFKGFIDAVVEVPTKKGQIVWVLDHKSCQWGWDQTKKRDVTVRNQLVLYKTFWCQRSSVPLKDVRAGFVLLKKNAAPGTRCELFSVSVGDTSSERALKAVTNAVSSIAKGLTIKNRMNCDRCDLKGTAYCT